MNDLKQFLQNNNAKRSHELVVSKQVSHSLAINELSLKSNVKEQFSEKVADLACSDNVISELSSKVGDPLENESENQFVERAKSTLASILRKILSK